MYEFLAYRVADVMTIDPIVVEPDTTLAEVEQLFTIYRFNGLPVVGADGALLGVVTKLDVLKAFAFTAGSLVPAYQEIMSQPVSRFMTEDAATVSPETPLTRVLETMVRTRYKSLPVLQDGCLVGIVAREDVIRALRRAAGLTAMPAA